MCVCVCGGGCFSSAKLNAAQHSGDIRETSVHSWDYSSQCDYYSVRQLSIQGVTGIESNIKHYQQRHICARRHTLCLCIHDCLCGLYGIFNLSWDYLWSDMIERVFAYYGEKGKKYRRMHSYIHQSWMWEGKWIIHHWSKVWDYNCFMFNKKSLLTNVAFICLKIQ